MIPRPEVGRRERCSDRCPCRLSWEAKVHLDAKPPLRTWSADGSTYGPEFEPPPGYFEALMPIRRPKPGPPLPVEFEDERSEG